MPKPLSSVSLRLLRRTESVILCASAGSMAERHAKSFNAMLDTGLNLSSTDCCLGVLVLRWPSMSNASYEKLATRCPSSVVHGGALGTASSKNMGTAAQEKQQHGEKQQRNRAPSQRPEQCTGCAQRTHRCLGMLEPRQSKRARQNKQRTAPCRGATVSSVSPWTGARIAQVSGTANQEWRGGGPASALCRGKSSILPAAPQLGGPEATARKPH